MIVMCSEKLNCIPKYPLTQNCPFKVSTNYKIGKDLVISQVLFIGVILHLKAELILGWYSQLTTYKDDYADARFGSFSKAGTYKNMPTLFLSEC